MAIDYTDLFTNIGALVKASNVLADFVPVLKAEKNNIYSVLNASNKYEVMKSVEEVWSRYESSTLGWIGDCTSRIYSLLNDKQSILEELPIGVNSGFNVVFPLLYADMVTNDKNVTANSVTLGSVTKNTVKTDTGTVLLDKVLDGVTAPGFSYPACREYNGITSQLSIDDSVILRCIQDSEMSTLSPGDEVFAWVGAIPGASTFSLDYSGTGNGPNLRGLHLQSLLSNLLFESFSGNTPSNFTLNSGTSGTHIFKDTTGQYEGSSGLKFTGDGTQASIQISQSIDTARLTPLKRYVFVCHLKGQTGTSSGTFTIQFEGTGYTAGASEKIELNAATLAGLTTWTRYSFYINIPLEIPDDLKLVIKWTGTPSAHSVRVDNGAFGTPTWINGFNIVLHKGSEKFLYGDTISFTVSNSNAGVFQTHARKALGVQWPTDATPTISDTLAQ